MKTIAILQARMTSTRLPGKSLLPVAGYASAVLAALRASNLGNPLIVATSEDPSDDALAEACRQNEIRIHRGALQDVLSRFNSATSDFAPGDTLVRLTADNVLPDGELVLDVARRFRDSGLEYLSVEWPRSRVPYGVSAEAFSVATLRAAHARAVTIVDREHVVPWIVRNCSTGVYSPEPVHESHVHLRCTIDDHADYQRMVRLFEGLHDPIKIGWRELVEKLASSPEEPSFRVPHKILGHAIHSELTLGTAQLGMEYGVVNSSGKPSRKRSTEIVLHAARHGVTMLDTARTYGDAEDIIREARAEGLSQQVQVITKIELSALPPQASRAAVESAVENSVAQSCRALGANALQTSLLHRWSHHDDWYGAAWRKLLELRDKGRIAALGVSVYEPEEALAALRDSEIQHLQIPLNILDGRWKSKGVDGAIADRPDVVVHARSVFLQGILLHPADTWPQVGGYDAADCVSALQTLVGLLKRESVADLCVAYVRSLPWITSLVLGCDTLEQLDTNLRLFCRPRLDPEQCDLMERTIPVLPDALLNPAKWNHHYESAAPRG